jgi:hypothetical protein
MGRRFQPARNAKTVPQVQSMQYATGQVYQKGALVVDNVNGEIVECGADPVSILGVALEACDSKPGYGVPNSAQVTVTTGRQQETSIALADRDTVFSGRAVNGGVDPVVPLLTHIGEKYGVVKVGNDWVIDMADAVATRIQIVDVDLTGGNVFFFKFLEANLARP